MPTRFHFLITTAGLLLFLLAAWFSVGFHHPDEHFQIIEFCNYKLGNIPASDLSWEFEAQIRPALPVVICYGIISAQNFIGMTDPFMQAFVLRLLMAILVWYVLKKLTHHVLPDFKSTETGKLFMVAIFTLWFMPYISVRFSSENQAALCFLAACLILLKNTSAAENKKSFSLFAAGVLLALSFYFRFQMGFALLGIGLWLLFVNRMPFKHWVGLLGGGMLGLALCTAMDYWLYGAWVVSPYNYFTANVVNDAASGWGVSPWWYYLYLSFIQAIPPIGLFILIFFFPGCFRRGKHLFLWALVPFMLAHFLVPHKEMRFLFPMIFPILYITFAGAEAFILTPLRAKLKKGILLFLLIVNIPLLFFRTLAPAREIVYYYDFLYDFAQDKKITLLCVEEDLYLPAFLPIHFYRSPNVSTLVLADESALERYLAANETSPVFLLERKRPINGSYQNYADETLYTFFPDWLTAINVNNWTARAKIWKIKKLTHLPMAQLKAEK